MIRHTAGQTHDLREENIDDVGNTHSQIVRVSIHHFATGGIALGCRIKRRTTGHIFLGRGNGVQHAFGVGAPGFLRHANQRRGAGKAFKTPGTTAGAAGRAGHILNDHVPQFRCRAGVAGQNLTVQHNTAAHAGAQGHNNGTLGALSTPRKCLAKCSDIGIIPNHHRQVCLSLQVAAHLKIVPIEVV